MLYKLISEHKIEPIAKNDFIIIDGEHVGVSNLPEFFAEHPDIATENGYYELVETVPPEYDAEKQYVVFKYVIEDNKICKIWHVENIIIPEE